MKQEERKHTDDIFEDIREIFKQEPHSLIIISSKSREQLEKKYGRPTECWDLEQGFCSISQGVESFRNVKNGTILDMMGLERKTQNLYYVVFYYYLDEAQNCSKQFMCYDDRTEKIIYLQ